MAGWKLMFFERGPRPAPAGAGPDVKRGAYIVDALGHCGECHTQRNELGALDRSRWLGGNSDGPGGPIPNITPHPETGIGKWSAGDIVSLLQSGMTPGGDFVGGEMAEVVEQGGSKLTADDAKAVAAYLKAIPPINNKPARRAP
jgi:mono/diheme cytochrome c family protein